MARRLHRECSPADLLAKAARRKAGQYKERRNWPLTLADKYGLWCAGCQNYVGQNTQNSVEFHHLLEVTPSARNVFKGFVKIPTASWAVPVCHKCHTYKFRGLAAGFTEDLITTWARSGNHIAQLADRAHQRGEHSTGVLLNFRVASLEQEVKAFTRAQYCQASASATSWGAEFVSRNLYTAENIKGGLGLFEIQLNAAKIEAINGDWDKARKRLQRCQAEFARSRKSRPDAWEGSLARATASILSHTPEKTLDLQPALDCAERAISMSFGYPRWTAQILKGELLFKLGEQKKAAACFGRLLDAGNELPWQYEAMAYFFRALLAKPLGRDEEAVYRDLVRAQFIDCMLGLHGHAHRAVSDGLNSNAAKIMPGHLLRVRELQLTRPGTDKDRRTALRKKAIGPSEDTESLWSRVRLSLQHVDRTRR